MRAIDAVASPQAQTGKAGALSDRARYSIYALAMLVSVSLWFLAIGAPLWLDETVSIFLIKGGFRGIMGRQVWPDSPAYSCILWLWTEAFGRGEVTLRILSVLVMSAATYLLYLAARALFSRDVAIIAAVVFCLHPVIVFEAIDIRPYAFAALTITAAILLLVRLRESDSTWLAGWFGFSAACIVYLQLLFATILPALLLCLVAGKWRDRKTMWRQLGIALVVFAIAALPVIPRLEYMFHTSGTHVFSEVPKVGQLLSLFSLKALVVVLVAAVLVAWMRRELDLRRHPEDWPLLLCASLALIPSLLLFAISVGTSIHVFVPRYRLVAIPGVALSWAYLVSRIDSRNLRLLFCGVLVLAAVVVHWTSPSLKLHQYSWKYAIAFAEQNASPDRAPVLMCSDLPEADHMRMPEGEAIAESGILPPLSYYKLSVPVTPLPRSLNAETERAGAQFVQQESERHQRFLAMAFAQSYGTLDWLRRYAAATYSVRDLGEFEGVKVLEFKPRV